MLARRYLVVCSVTLSAFEISPTLFPFREQFEELKLPTAELRLAHTQILAGNRSYGERTIYMAVTPYSRTVATPPQGHGAAAAAPVDPPRWTPGPFPSAQNAARSGRPETRMSCLQPSVRQPSGLAAAIHRSPVYGEVECPFPFALADLSHIREVVKRFTRRTTGYVPGRPNSSVAWSSGPRSLPP